MLQIFMYLDPIFSLMASQLQKAAALTAQWLSDLGETNGHCNGYCNVGEASMCRHATPMKVIKATVSLSVHVCINYRISRPGQEENIIQIVLIGGGSAQFLRASQFV